MRALRIRFVLVILSCVASVGVNPSQAAQVARTPPAAQAAQAAESPVRVPYRLPVVGTVVDPYRPPTGPYGPGNRGIDLASVQGSAVVAPADGEVTFAGQVGGRLFVVVRHADGIRTTMGDLASVAVAKGQAVIAGQTVGTTSGVIHFGARVGTAYIDPSLLLLRGTVRLIK